MNSTSAKNKVVSLEDKERGVLREIKREDQDNTSDNTESGGQGRMGGIQR